MAMITGRVQMGKQSHAPTKTTIGEPFAYKKDNKWFCKKTGRELKVISVSGSKFKRAKTVKKVSIFRRILGYFLRTHDK